MVVIEQLKTSEKNQEEVRECQDLEVRVKEQQEKNEERRNCDANVWSQAAKHVMGCQEAQRLNVTCPHGRHVQMTSLSEGGSKEQKPSVDTPKGSTKSRWRSLVVNTDWSALCQTSEEELSRRTG